MSGLSEINVAFMAHASRCSICGSPGARLCKQGAEILRWFHKVLVAEAAELPFQKKKAS
jgi:hypothetical protein